MENQTPSLFDIGIDDVGQAHLTSIAKWNKFLGWVGIICCGLALIAIIFGGSFFMSNFSRGMGNAYSNGAFAGMLFVYVIFIALFLIPCLYRLSFANKMLKALGTNDQFLLNESLSHFKSFSKFWGVLTIIIVAIYAIIFLITLLTFTMR